MRTHTLARGSALAGLAAASATAAHGGSAALADPAWSLPALLAAAAGTAALLRLTAAAGRARAAVARVPCGRPCHGHHPPLGLAETTAIMLAAQGCAHLALLAAGAPAHPGQTGAARACTPRSPCSARRSCGRPTARLAAPWTLTAAIAAAVELLLAVLAPARRPPSAAPGRPPPPGRRHGRAPPATA